MSRFRVGRMVFRNYMIRARSGFTTTFIVTDYQSRGYVADARAIHKGITSWVESCSIEDEYEWKIAFRREMDRQHKIRSQEDSGRRRGWNRIHYPLPGYREVRRRYLKHEEDKDTFFEDWAWGVYSGGREKLSGALGGIADTLPVLPSPKAIEPVPERTPTNRSTNEPVPGRRVCGVREARNV